MKKRDIAQRPRYYIAGLNIISYFIFLSSVLTATPISFGVCSNTHVSN